MYNEILYEGIPDIPLDIRIRTLENLIESRIAEIELGILNNNEYPNDYSEAHLFLLEGQLKFCNELKKIKINDEQDLEYVEWLFNDGSFRKEYEIKAKIREFNEKAEQTRIHRVKNSKSYQEGYHPYGVFIATLLITPMIITFFMGASNGGGVGESFSEFLLDLFAGGLLLLSIGIIPILIFAALITLLYCKYHAWSFNVPIDTDVVLAVTTATVASCTMHYLQSKKKKESTIPKEV